MIFRFPTLKTAPHASAIIDGTLCQFNRHGLRSMERAPLGSAVMEFRQGSLCFYVREQPSGLLPGLANLYCLDGDFRLLWMADWPEADDPCAAILQEADGVLMARALSGAMVRLDSYNGRLLGADSAMAAAS